MNRNFVRFVYDAYMQVVGMEPARKFEGWQVCPHFFMRKVEFSVWGPGKPHAIFILTPGLDFELARSNGYDDELALKVLMSCFDEEN